MVSECTLSNDKFKQQDAEKRNRICDNNELAAQVEKMQSDLSTMNKHEHEVPRMSTGGNYDRDHHHHDHYNCESGSLDAQHARTSSLAELTTSSASDTASEATIQTQSSSFSSKPNKLIKQKNIDTTEDESDLHTMPQDAADDLAPRQGQMIQSETNQNTNNVYNPADRRGTTTTIHQRRHSNLDLIVLDDECQKVSPNGRASQHQINHEPKQSTRRNDHNQRPLSTAYLLAGKAIQSMQNAAADHKRRRDSSPVTFGSDARGFATKSRARKPSEPINNTSSIMPSQQQQQIPNGRQEERRGSIYMLPLVLLNRAAELGPDDSDDDSDGNDQSPIGGTETSGESRLEQQRRNELEMVITGRQTDDEDDDCMRHGFNSCDEMEYGADDDDSDTQATDKWMFEDGRLTRLEAQQRNQFDERQFALVRNSASSPSMLSTTPGHLVSGRGRDEFRQTVGLCACHLTSDDGQNLHARGCEHSGASRHCAKVADNNCRNCNANCYDANNRLVSKSCLSHDDDNNETNCLEQRTIMNPIMNQAANGTNSGAGHFSSAQIGPRSTRQEQRWRNRIGSNPLDRLRASWTNVIAPSAANPPGPQAPTRARRTRKADADGVKEQAPEISGHIGNIITTCNALDCATRAKQNSQRETQTIRSSNQLVGGDPTKIERHATGQRRSILSLLANSNYEAKSCNRYADTSGASIGRLRASSMLCSQSALAELTRRHQMQLQQKATEFDPMIPESGYKIVVMGNSGTGKTALIHRFLYGTFSARHLPTVEDTYFVEFPYKKNTINISLSDTSGTYEFPAMKRLAINSGDAFILVYSVDEPKSFDDLEQLRETILNEREQAYLEACASLQSSDSCASSGLASSQCSSASTSMCNSNNSVHLVSAGGQPPTARTPVGACQQQQQHHHHHIHHQQASPSRNRSLASLFGNLHLLHNQQHHEQTRNSTENQHSATLLNSARSSLCSTGSSNFFSSASSSNCSSAENSRRSSISAAEAALKTKRTRRPPMVIVANKHDLPRDKHQVNSDEIEALAVIDWNNGFVRASAALNWNVDEIFQQVLSQAKQPPTLAEAIASKRRKSLPPKLPHT